MIMRKVGDEGIPSEANESSTNGETARGMWKQFVGNTTLHGIRYAFLARPVIVRLLWFFLLLTTGGYYIVTVYKAINKFYDRPINTVMSKTHVKEMGFPAVTICPLNLFARSKLLMTDDDPLFAFSGLNISSCVVTAEVRQTIPCGLSMICCCRRPEYQNASYALPNCTRQYRQELWVVMKRASYSPDSESFIRYYSQDISELLGPICQFGRLGTPCSSSDFVPNVTPWGMCYTFNSGEGSTVRKVNSAGATSGLTVVLDAQLAEYTQGKFSKGFKVLVHGQGEHVDEWEGINVAPGTHAVITVSQQRFKNLENPYVTNCSEERLKTFSNYTLEGCIYECEAEAVVESCGCRPNGYKGAPGIKTCVNQVDTNCSDWCIATMNTDFCHCEVPCNQVKYVTEVSYAKFPDPGTSEAFLQAGYYMNEEYISENLVLLQVGFKSLSYEKFEQQPAYDSNALFGEIGGNMGLFLGCSLLTICEFVDFALSLLALRRRSKPHPA